MIFPIFQLTEPLAFSSSQQPVQLPTEKTNKDTVALLTGWGSTKDFDSPPATKLQSARTRVLTSEQCEDYAPNVANEQICASSGNGIGACSVSHEHVSSLVIHIPLLGRLFYQKIVS